MKITIDQKKIQEAQAKAEALKNYTMADFDKVGYSELMTLYTKFGIDIFDFKEEILDSKGKVIGVSHTFIPELLAKFFAIKYYIKFCPASYYKLPSEMYRYNEKRGIYVGNTETELITEIAEMYKDRFSKVPTELIFKTIRAITQTKRPEVDEHPYYIPMGRDTIHILNMNGKYSIEIISHSPERFILIGIPNSYEFYNENGLPDHKREGRAGEIFHKYLNATLPDTKDQTILQEFAGIGLLRLQLYNKNLICLGKTRSGKTTLINVIRNSLGRENCSQITFAEMSNNRFHTAELDGKLLNICDDLSNVDVANVSQFKVITGGTDRLGVERKFRDPTTIVPIAKHLFTANELPAVGDADSAFFGRFFIMKFKQSFPDEDEFIDKRLNTSDINTYILRWAMEGLLRVLNNRGYTYKQSPKEIYDIWNENMSNPIVAYMNSENVIYEQYGLYLSSELEEDICKFAENRIFDELRTKKPKPSIQEIGRYITNMRDITKERHLYQGLQKIFYRGMKPNKLTDYQDFDRNLQSPEELEEKQQKDAKELVGVFVEKKGLTVSVEDLLELVKAVDGRLEEEENEEKLKILEQETEELEERHIQELAEITEQERLVKDYEDYLNTPEPLDEPTELSKAEKLQKDFDEFYNSISEPTETIEESESDRQDREYKEWAKQQDEPDEPPKDKI